MAPLVDEIKALIFDVFGTLVDWRTSIAREAQAIMAPLGVAIDWLAFADAWRAQYQPAMEEVRAGRLPFCKLDVLHRRNLDIVLSKLDIDLDEPTRHHLNLAWHRLDAWPDTVAGLTALHRQFVLAPCSNGNIALMVDLARRNKFPWDAILGAEIARDYKPNPIVYRAAAEALDLRPSQTMMVAAHSNDLAAAANAGLATAFVARVDEFGPNTGETKPSTRVDFAATDLLALAALLAT